MVWSPQVGGYSKREDSVKEVCKTINGEYQKHECTGQIHPGCCGIPPSSHLAEFLCLHECFDAGTNLFTLVVLGQRGRSSPCQATLWCHVPPQAPCCQRRKFINCTLSRRKWLAVREVERKHSLSNVEEGIAKSQGGKYVTSDFGAIL